jgi:hypothetical protein
LADIYEKNDPSNYEQALELQSKATSNYMQWHGCAHHWVYVL